MSLIEQRKVFEQTKNIYESVTLKFHGADGFDVYNSSIPFTVGGKRYIFGRVERRNEWARSWIMLFESTDNKDEWSRVEDAIPYQLEDPYISFIDGLLVMGGTYVVKSRSQIKTYNSCFYKGTDVRDLYYFETGPEYMKDVRLVQLGDGRIGVFSRPRNDEVREKYGSDAVIGFAIIDSLDGLSAEVIENAEVIPDMFDEGEWGGCNQCYLLENGSIGVIGHRCYKDDGAGTAVYLNTAFVFDPNTHTASDFKIIGTRSCYPDGDAKYPELVDCAFTGGIVMREDGRADLYSGINDVGVGRITIDYPFGESKIVE